MTAMTAIPERRLDLNALLDLQALLDAGSVTGAAQRLHLSVPAMSRRLGHLRDVLGDPLFVPAGRRLVPTARALALAPRVGGLVDEVRRVLAPERVDLARVERTLVLRANDGFVGAWSAALAARVAREAPGLVLRFVPRTDKDPGPLRRGEVDLDLGVAPTGATAAAEILRETLFEATFVVAMRDGHPLGRRRRLSLEAFVQWPHVVASRSSRVRGAIDAALRTHGLTRPVPLVVPGFQAALAVAVSSDCLATLPAPFARWARATMPLHVAAMPVETPAASVSMSWHPRQDADGVHRWLREQVRATCAQAGAG
jgi:DNA-binding transcriptional LysR family regulator